jgi:hypothetical protein
MGIIYSILGQGFGGKEGDILGYSLFLYEYLFLFFNKSVPSIKMTFFLNNNNLKTTYNKNICYCALCRYICNLIREYIF